MPDPFEQMAEDAKRDAAVFAMALKWKQSHNWIAYQVALGWCGSGDTLTDETWDWYYKRLKKHGFTGAGFDKSPSLRTAAQRAAR
jgi:hypothetical protein